MRAALLLLLLLLLAGPPAQAQAPRLDAAVRAYVAPFADAGDFSGVALIMRGDTILAQVAAGEAAPGRPVTADTRFRIGSLTKPFTSAAVLRLVRQGLVALASSVCEYLAPCPEAWRPVTVRHLLSHTAGLPNYTAFPDYDALKAQAVTPEALVARFSARPLEFVPGSRFAYSNAGYAVLGRVLESVTGQPYAEALRTLVTAPLRLAGVHYGDVPEGAAGFRIGAGGREPAAAIDLSVPYAAGALVASAAEVAAFARGFFRDDFLPDSLRTAALTPVQGRYGLGWVTAPLGPGRAASHAGGIDGFVSFVAYRPDQDVAVVVLANVEGAPVQRMALDLVRLADGMPVPPPVVRRAVVLPEADLSAVVGTYRLAPAVELVVRRAAGGGLETQLTTGQPAFPLFAEARDAFFLRAVDAQLTFEHDAQGQVVRAVLHQGGRSQPAARV